MQFSSTSCSPDDESHENGLWPQCIYLNSNWKRFRSQPGLFDWTKGKDGRWIWPQCIFNIWIINEQFWFEEYWFSARVTRLEMSRRPEGPAPRLLTEKIVFCNNSIGESILLRRAMLATGEICFQCLRWRRRRRRELGQQKFPFVFSWKPISNL